MYEMDNLPLCDNIADSPGLHFVFKFLFYEFHTELAEILAVGRPMEAKLHGYLHHHSTQHKSRIRRGAADGEWPRT